MSQQLPCYIAWSEDPAGRRFQESAALFLLHQCHVSREDSGYLRKQGLSSYGQLFLPSKSFRNSSNDDILIWVPESRWHNLQEDFYAKKFPEIWDNLPDEYFWFLRLLDIGHKSGRGVPSILGYSSQRGCRWYLRSGWFLRKTEYLQAEHVGKFLLWDKHIPFLYAE